MIFPFFGSSFENCLQNLTVVLQICKEKNLALNCQKGHFMVKGGIVHKISAEGLEVDQAKIFVIDTLVPPTIVKGESEAFLDMLASKKD